MVKTPTVIPRIRTTKQNIAISNTLIPENRETQKPRNPKTTLAYEFVMAYVTGLCWMLEPLLWVHYFDILSSGWIFVVVAADENVSTVCLHILELKEYYEIVNEARPLSGFF